MLLEGTNALMVLVMVLHGVKICERAYRKAGQARLPRPLAGLSMWVLTQQFFSIAKPFLEIVPAIVNSL